VRQGNLDLWLRLEYRRKKDGDRFCLATPANARAIPCLYRPATFEERILVVILTDRGPSRRLEICDAIVNILHNKPYVMPKLSIAMRIVPTIKSRGVDAGIEEYERFEK